MSLLPVSLLISSLFVSLASAQDVVHANQQNSQSSFAISQTLPSKTSLSEFREGSPDEITAELIEAGIIKRGGSIGVYDARREGGSATDVLGYTPEELDGVELRVVVVVDSKNKAADVRYELVRIKDPKAGMIKDHLSEEQQDEINALKFSVFESDQTLSGSRHKNSEYVLKELLESINRMPLRVSVEYAASSGAGGRIWSGGFQPLVMMQDPDEGKGLQKQDSLRDSNEKSGGGPGKTSGDDQLHEAERREQAAGSQSGDQPPVEPGKSKIPDKVKGIIKQGAGYPFTWLVALVAGLGSNPAFDALQRKITEDPRKDLEVATDEVHSNLLQFYGQSTILIRLTPAEFSRQLAGQNNSEFRRSETFYRYGYVFKGTFFRARKNDEFQSAFPGCPCPQGPVWDTCGAHIGIPESDLFDVQLPALDFGQDKITLAGTPQNVTPTYWCPCNVCEVPKQPSGEIEASAWARLGWDIMFVAVPTVITFLVEYYTWHKLVYLKYIQPMLSSRYGI